ncbi:MAG TPA: helix-turn-helix domain-containing protein [Candidatus Binataceae bacterium]|nr:helix-turn-helix domain-containing protein [Candidatus Binataceae bacterium]
MLPDGLGIDPITIPAAEIPAALAALAALQTALAARLMTGSSSATHTAATDADPLLTAQEAASRLHLAVSYVYELVRSQQLPAIRSGKYVRIRASAVERFITQHENGAPLDRPIDIMSTTRHGTQGSAAAATATRINPSRACSTARPKQDDGKQVGTRIGADSKGHGGTAEALGEAAAEGALTKQ